MLQLLMISHRRNGLPRTAHLKGITVTCKVNRLQASSRSREAKENVPDNASQAGLPEEAPRKQAKRASGVKQHAEPAAAEPQQEAHPLVALFTAAAAAAKVGAQTA